MAGQVISRLTSSGGTDAGVHVISSSFYGTCSTAANEKAKVVVISNHNINQIKLVKGMTLNVKFINDNTATEIPTLAIYSNQSNTDAENPTVGTGLTVPYNIYVKEEDTILPLKPKWSAGSIVTFVYDEFRDDEEVNHPRWIKISSSNEELIDRVNELDNRTQVAVQEVDMEYAPSQSNTEAPTSGWETSISTYTPGWYVWQRTKTLNVGSSTPNYSDPICITGRDGTPGPAGASAYQYSLLCSPSALIRNMNATAPVNVPSAITFSATYAEGSNTPSAYLGYFDVRQTVDGTNWTTLTSGSGQSSIICTPTTAAVAVKCTLSSQADTNIYLDTQTVPIIETGKDGEDAYTAYLTNDSHSFAATDDNAAVTASVSSQFIVMKGNTSVTATISTITCWPDTALENGLTVTWANNTFTASVSPSLSVTDYPTGGYLYITASAENQNFEKQFSWLLVPAGTDGTNATNFRSISLYKRVAPNTGNPTRPDNELIYNFSTDTLSPIDNESFNTTPTYDGWYRQIPEGSDPCWTIMANALASTTAATDTIAIDDWTSPVMLVKDGEDGLNNATLYLYQRNNSDIEPSLPDEDFTYIFNTGLSPTYQIGNWYGSVSAATITAGDEYYPCWMTTAPVISADNSVLVTSGSWTNPVIYINPARGISAITEKYLKTTASTGVTTATSGWIIPSTTTPIPNPDSTNRFIWNYEITTYTDGDTDETTPHIVATYGIDGQSIYSVIDYYKTTTAASLPTKREVDGGPSGSGENGWMTPSTTTPVPQVDKNNKYLWNYERTEYRNPTSTASTAVRLIGAYGDDGIHPTQFVEQKILWDYDDSDLDTHPAPGDNDAWEDGDVIWESNKFIWARTKIIWSDNNPSTHPHITYTDPVLANTYNSISEIAANANETASSALVIASSASVSASEAIASASQAFQTASDALGYAVVAATAAEIARTQAEDAYNAAVSAQTSASLAASAAATAQASADLAITAAASASSAASAAVQSASIAYDYAASAVTSASVAYNAAASAVACASAAFNAAASAQTSASQAAQSANSAALSATAAELSATTASAAAVNAENSALIASQNAESASAAASIAVQSANVAVTSASLAVQSASVAATSASQAATSADQAAQSASAAVTSASLAAQSASAANIAVNSALTQLSIVEDVAGTLDWISKHGSYIKTTDTTVQDGTVYFVRSGSNEPYTYTPVTNPEGNPKSQGWYVLDITDSQSKYIMAHLAVTSAGLWILPSAVEEYSAATDTAAQSGITYYTRSGSIGNYVYTIVPTPTGNPKTQGWYTRTTDKASGYKTLLSDSGMSIYDNSGTVVATYGEGISFDSNRSFTIGDESASIIFNGNGQITISGSGVNIGSTVSIGGLNGAINEAINNLEIGGRNLLLWTKDLPKGSDNSVNGKDGIAAWGNALSLLSETEDGIKLTAANNPQGCIGIPLANNGSVDNNEDVLLTFEARGNITSVGQFYWLQASGANVNITNWLNGQSTIALSETEWTKFTTNVKSSQANVRTCTRILMFYALGSANNGKWIEIRKGSVKLEKGNKATDWTPAPEDVEASISNVETTANNAAPKASAVKRTQRIYYRTSSSMNSWTMPTTWLTTTGDVFNRWTCKVPRMTANADGTGTKYLYLYTCEQREMANGTLEYTTVLLDDSTTIIDGGNIITGSITANKLNAANINASQMLTVGSMTTTAANSILNSNIVIGGKNLLGNTENRSGSTIGTNSAATSTFGSIGSYNDATSLYSLVDYDGYSNAVFCATSTSTGNRGVGWYTKVGEIQAGETYTFSCRIKCSIDTSVHMHTAWRNNSATANYVGWTSAGTKTISANTWTDYSYTFVPASNANLNWEFYVAMCITGSSSGATYQIAHAKLEKGTKATDWSPAPEELQANAVKRTQRIYYRKSDTGAPTAPSSWVNSSNDGSNAWTQKHMSISSADKYIYTCEQYEMADGKFGNTPILLDDTITVIDGGNIITGSITANAIKAGTITAGLISANTITAGLIDASNLHVNAANINGTITFGKLPDAIASASDIPTAVSQLTNDSGYATTTGITNTLKSYATTANLNAEIAQRKAQYGTSSAEAGDQTKKVTCSNFELVAGNELTVKFTNANTYIADSVQLNVNEKGAKKIWVANEATSSSNQLLWAANSYITFRYDGTQFITIGEPRTWYGTCSTVANTKAKTSTISGCVICKGAKVELAMTYDNTYEKDASNNSDPPTLNISSSGARNIYFGTGTTIPTKANGTSWLAKSTATFTFDGQYWRTAGKTYLDANSITTGKITADYIDVDDINAQGLFTAGSLEDTLQNDITNGVTAYNRATAYRGVCSTDATTATKAVTCNNFPDLSEGIAITVYNTKAQTATANLSLKINNGNTKLIYVNGAVTSDTNRLLWEPNSSVTYVYDGNYWRVADNPGGWYGSTCTAAEATQSKTTMVNQAVIFKGTAISVPMTNTNTNTAATLKIQDSSGNFLTNTTIYYGSTNTIPTKGNGYAWLPNSELILTYDGKFWRTGHQTFINGGNILANSITAAQIQASTITAGLIDATDLHVDAANIDGTITASKINIRNSLTIGDFTVDAQDLILNEKVENQIGELNGTLSDDFNNTIQNLRDDIASNYVDNTTLQNELDRKLNAGELANWLTATPGALTLGKQINLEQGQKKFEAKLDADSLDFVIDNTTVASYGGEEGMTIPKAKIENAIKINNWSISSSGGILTIKYVGG